MNKVVNSNTRIKYPIRLDPEKIIKLDKWKIYLLKVKRKLLSHVWFVRIFIISILVIFLFTFGLIVKNLLSNSKLSYYYVLSKNFLFAPSDKIETADGRINILVLGKGGGNHEAPDLTDTIMFVSINPKNDSLTMISLPRDIWIPELRAKLNSIYYWGNEKKKGGGLVLTKSVVEDILGQSVQYGIVIDFEGFKEIINTLGGIEVDVERSFTDNKYPIAGKENDSCGGDPELRCRYENVHFDQGKQYMDGDTALKFARSRNAEGDEGTDLARDSRQQKVINAIKNKMISGKTILSPKKMSDIKTVVNEHVETDIDSYTAAVLARYLFDARNNFKSFVLDEEFLVNPPKLPDYDNLYVFVPKDNSWSKVQEWVKKLTE